MVSTGYSHHSYLYLRSILYILYYQRVSRLSMQGWHQHAQPKHNSSELSNAAALSLFRNTACSTGVSIHGKTLKVGIIHCYNGTWKFLNRQFLHLFLNLILQTIYLKIDKRTHLYFSIKRFLSVWCMILGEQNRRTIPFMENDKALRVLLYSRTPFPH